MKGTTLAIFGLLGTSVALAGTGLYYNYEAEKSFSKIAPEMAALQQQTADVTSKLTSVSTSLSQMVGSTQALSRLDQQIYAQVKANGNESALNNELLQEILSSLKPVLNTLNAFSSTESSITSTLAAIPSDFANLKMYLMYLALALMMKLSPAIIYCSMLIRFHLP